MSARRLVGPGVAALLFTPVFATSAAHAAAPVVSGRTVAVSEKVPTTVKVRVKGKSVSTRIARPVELQQLTGSTWNTVAKATSSKAGAKTFTYKTVSSTKLRVIAPKYAKTVKLKVKKTSKKVRVALKAYASPARAITVTPHTAMVSRGLDGKASNTGTGASTMDASGRFVAFNSFATNLVDAETHGDSQVYLRDAVTNKTVLISHAAGGDGGQGSSHHPDVSADGRFVVFESSAEDLVPGGSERGRDIYLWDRGTGRIEVISQKLGGGAADGPSFAPTVSGDGRYVAFVSYATNLTGSHDGSLHPHVYRFDRESNRARRVTFVTEGPVNGGSDLPSINDEGNLVAYTSTASNLVPGDTNGMADVFLTDLDTSRTSRVTRTPEGGPVHGISYSPQISGDGSRVVYESLADDLVAGDDNEVGDVFAFEVELRRNTLVSRSAKTGLPANGTSYRPSVSGNGRVIAFESSASDLVSGAKGGQIFAYDVRTGAMVLASQTPAGARPNGPSYLAALTGDGRRVSFTSSATDLVQVDDTASDDIFVRDLS